MEVRSAASMYNMDNVSDVNNFNQVLKTLLDGLTNRAASSNSLCKFAIHSSTTTENNQTIYALVQCTPDFSKQDRSNCLVRTEQIIKI